MKQQRDESTAGAGGEKPTGELTGKQAAFIAHYLANGFNATRAAISAGYSQDSAESQASDLLRNPKVSEAIRQRLEAEGITPQRCKIALAQIAFGGNMADYEDLLRGRKTLADLQKDGIPTDAIRRIRVTRRAAGKGGGAEPYEDVTLELYDRLAALSKVADLLGLVTQRHHVTGPASLEDILKKLRETAPQRGGTDDEPRQ